MLMTALGRDLMGSDVLALGVVCQVIGDTGQEHIKKICWCYHTPSSRGLCTAKGHR